MEATIVQSRHIAGHPTHTPHEGATETGPHDSGVDDEIAPTLVEPTDAAARVHVGEQGVADAPSLEM